MGGKILVSVRPWETRVAYLQNDELVDYAAEQRSSPTYVGAIFKGKVLRVLPGIQAAFVDIGLEKAGFLYVRDILPHWDEEDFDSGATGPQAEGGLDDVAPAEKSGEVLSTPREPIEKLLHEGQWVMVQVAKDPLGSKGPRLTMNRSFAGRFVVYMPTVEHVGISRKIEDASERERLRQIIEASAEMKGAGVICRTAAEGVLEEELLNDLRYLRQLSDQVQKAFEKKRGVGLLYQEPDLELRALRDLFHEEVDEIWVDEAQVQKKMEEFLNKLSPGHHCAVRVFQGPGELFDKFHVELEVSRALERKIWLKSGGYIVFDEAEALVVIDVNTGKYVGKKDFEDTIFKTNLEAAKEIAHQIRLRNIGGIIVVDFIDMKDPGHREKVLETLAHELKKDRARTQVMSMSSLGLVEITRKRTRPSLNKQLTRSCTYCEGRGFIKRPGTVGLELMRELEKHMSHPLARQMGSKIRVQCHPEVMDWVYEHTMTYIQGLEAQFQKVVEYESRGDFHREQFEVSYVRES